MLVPEIIQKYRRRNRLHTMALFASMLGLVSLLGYLLLGQFGLFVAVGLGILLMVLAPKISPQLVLRLYKARPINAYDAPNLYQIMQELAERAGLTKVPQLHYIPGDIMNAFALGSSQEAHIAISEGLLRTLNLREIRGVLAHEVSHVNNNDMQVIGFADLMSRLTNVLSTLGKILLIINLPLLLIGEVMVSWGAVLLLILAPTIAGLLRLALSRTREFNADLHAATLTQDPMGLASALSKIEHYSGNFLQQIIRSGYRVSEPAFFRTHPKTGERIARLREMKQAEVVLPPANQEVAVRALLERYLASLTRENIASGYRWRGQMLGFRF
ncbi:MAG TPA: peptidase M48 [Microscillaceae bacterium]|nr:peptidase M48 [Microscillaceae bacterium]